jgi:hypothetical protein
MGARAIQCLLLLSLSGCATMSSRTKTILSMIGVGVVAGTVDANIGENRGSFNSHSMAVGLGAAAITGVGAMYYFKEEERRIEAERQLEVAKKEISSLRGEDSGAEAGQELNREFGLRRDLPPEYRGLVQPGSWTLYRTNTWVAQGENTLVHQDRILRIDPPRFQNPQIEAKKGEKNETN